MKKIMFLMMACGVFFIAANSVSAQNCVPKDNEVALFKDWKYNGECKVLKIGGYLNIETNAGFENDAVSSIKVGRNVQAVVCEHINFQGVCQTFTADNEFLEGTEIGNDRISSLKVFPQTPASDNNGNNNSSNANNSGCTMDKGGNAIPIKWVNKTRFKVRVEWINFDCKPEDRGSVEPGKTFVQESYNGHVFQISYYATESDEPRWIELKKVDVSPAVKTMNITLD